ncbi:RNA-dependent RNA polymerase [Purpureocillium lavendulum]|uniref:RNA-dependent RNA polymerase n=1 Tax=Purpureocillium lavendulum TaxID=1247861 RepID=A0AB34FJ39_9HYPO|nr:RNA-dependent RNA polymerase [Purpureocillium lavendulum]
MEVFLRNVPVNLTEDALKKELTPFINVLGITDWTVDKPKRKPLAFLSFLVEADGKRFLERHGKAPAPPPKPDTGGRLYPAQSQTHAHPNGHTRDIPRLHFLSTAIFAEKSNRHIGKLTLSHLRHERDERQRAPAGGPRAPAIVCPVAEIACGKMIFADATSNLTFARQTHLRKPGYAKFGRQALVVSLDPDVRIDIPYDIIQDLIADHRQQTITLVLEEPPRFYSIMANLTPHFQQSWERQTHGSWPDHAKYVAHCLVYELVLAGDYYHTIRDLKAQDILPVSQQGITVERSPKPLVHDYVTAMSSFDGRMQSLGTAREVILPFPVLFLVQELVWNNYLHPYGGLRVLEIIERTAKDPKWKGKLPFTTEAMKQLFQRIPYPVPGTEPSEVDPERLMTTVIETELDLRSQDPFRSGAYGSSLPRHQTWVFKAMVTPTRILLQGPDAESKNRVLRMFPQDGDHFLRVCFCDENGQDLSFNPKVSNEKVFDRYHKVLQDGLRIAGRHFSFLGFSHSSLRSHSTWFLAPFLDGNYQRQDHDTILKTLGDVSDIRIPAKCAARIGQAFSETPYAVDIFKTDIKTRYIPDVKSPDGKRVFSDGVGTISWDAMEEVWDALPMRSAAPTCFQIRWGGFKGMLALDSRLKGKVICLRKESMMKFPSRDMTELGICDVASRPLRLVLNRQVIKILEDMGTSDDWFFALQNKALNMLRAVTATATNTATFLRYQDVGSTLGLPNFIKQLDKMGIDYRRDRFLKSVVEHVVLRELRLLKHKARIPVDKGVTLFGIMDETGFLRENEVYVTYDKTHAKSGARMDATLTDGPVIVTRCPALHPGDVQYVTMVTPPESHPLRSLQNCVVFSQRGLRDLPSQLSGGDLDGDLYNVIWDPRAEPKEVFKPADYPRVAPPELDREVTRDDIAEFFINFMKSDILGLIANRHQILADVQEGGTNDGSCIQLAEMHSTAVDYSKTGIAVSASEMPRAPRSRPDFLAPAPPVKVYDLGQIDHILDTADGDDEDDGMARMRHRFHRSEKILGRLYRGIDEQKIWNQHIHRKIAMDGPSVWDQLMGRVEVELYSHGIKVDYRRYSEQAWKIRNLYEDGMSDNMWHFSDNPRTSISEAEVFCGSVLNKTGTQTRQQRDASIRLKEETDRLMTWITRQIRDRGGSKSAAAETDDTVDDSDEEDQYEAIQLSWACLVVGCIKDLSETPEFYRGTGELESFRVVAATCLLKELNALKVNGTARAPMTAAERAAIALGLAEDLSLGGVRHGHDIFDVNFLLQELERLGFDFT